MSLSSTKSIWDIEAGISDFSANPSDLSASVIPGIKAIWTEQRARLKGTKQLIEFTDRLSREWSIETGIIENLYELDRGVTQTLIERGFQSDLLDHGDTNKPKEFVLQLLRDQKDALDGVFDFVKNERDLSTSYIKELQSALLRSQKTTEAIDSQGREVEIPLLKGAWKEQPNSPMREGVTYFYCPPEHVSSEMDRLIDLHAQHIVAGVPPEVEAAWLHHRFTQIHPFQDGNGRVARALASLILVKEGLFPLVVTRDDKTEYVAALEAADQGDLQPLIALFARLQVTQFRKASAISEAVLAQDDVNALLGSLVKAADKVAAGKLEELRQVFGHAQRLEEEVGSRLKQITPQITIALKRIESKTGVASVSRSNQANSNWFRSQIIENAKNNLGYFVDEREYRSWVCLNMIWNRKARVAFAFHGIGRPFNGSLICAPFMEFRDTDEEGHLRSSLAPVAEEGFVFFYNEAEEKLVERFHPWLEGVLKVALRELMRNL